MELVKTLQEYAEEVGSMRRAARKLEKHPNTVYDWCRSGREYYVIEHKGKLVAVEIK